MGVVREKEYHYICFTAENDWEDGNSVGSECSCGMMGAGDH